MDRIRLTPDRISTLSCPPGKQQDFLWDAKVPCLAVRVTAAGAKSFVFESKLNRKTLRITLGDVRNWVLESVWIDGKEIQRGAREEANRLKAIVDQGKDPREIAAAERAAAEAKRLADERLRQAAAESEQRNRVTLAEAWEAYIEARRSKWGERHLQDHYKVMLGERTKGEGGSAKQLNARVLASLAQLPLCELTAERVAHWLENEIKTRSTQAALAYRLLRAFLNWCESEPEFRGIVDPSVCQSKIVRETVPKSKAKDDALQREQLRLWFSGVGSVYNRTVSVYLQGMLITGARPNELAGLRWADVDFRWRSLTIRDKVEGERTIPLTPYFASLLLDLKRLNETPPPRYRILHGRKVENDLEAWKPSELVFGSSRSLSGQIENAGVVHRKLLAEVGIPNVTLHGLRRSFGSLAEWVECPVGIVAQIQGHKPSATAEKHYRVRPIDLLRMWHTKIEAWILDQAGLEQPAENVCLDVIAR